MGVAVSRNAFDPSVEVGEAETGFGIDLSFEAEAMEMQLMCRRQLHPAWVATRSGVPVCSCIQYVEGADAI